MQVPILGQAAVTIPPQVRLNVAAMVDDAIASAAGLGLSFGRLKLQMPIDSNDIIYPLALEDFRSKRCEIVAVNEVAAQTQQGVILLISIVFQLPKSSLAS